MADVPLIQFPPGDQSPLVRAAVTTLLCTVLGAVGFQVTVDGMVVVTDEAAALAQLVTATATLQASASTAFEQQRWAAAGAVRAASA